MHAQIKEIVSSLIDESREYNSCPLQIKKIETEGYLITSYDQNKVVAVGMLHIMNENDEKEEVVGAFSINVKKYMWANAEGFSHDAMIEDLSEEVFTLMGVDEVVPYLCS